MKATIRIIVAVLSGCAVGFGALIAVEAIRHIIYPVPPDLDFSKLAVIRTHVRNYPLGAFLFVIAGWVITTLSGGITAVLIAPKYARLLANTIGIIVLTVTFANIIIIPHPIWVSLVGALGILLTVLVVPRVVAAFTSRDYTTSTGS